MSCRAFDFPDADLILRPCDGEGTNSQGCRDFNVHRCVLSAASSFFEAMFSLPQPGAEENAKPIIPFTESAENLEIVLRYIYPLPQPTIETLEVLASALEAAHKYDFTAAIDGLRRRLIGEDFLKAHPLRVYAIASRYDLEAEAKIASTSTLSVGLHQLPLHDDLKLMNAHAYHRLLLLHHDRATSAIALLKLPDDVRCMLCNGRRETVDRPPKWWAGFRERAEEELRARPTSEVVCSLSFLQQSAQASGCERCAGSILAAYWWFDQLKETIGALPATV